MHLELVTGHRREAAEHLLVHAASLPAELIHGSQQTERWRSAVIEWNNILCRDFKYFSFRDKLGFN